MQFRVINNKWVQQQEDNALFLNWLYNVDDEVVYKYLLEHCSKHINYLRSKYYNLECFDSIVNSSIYAVLQSRGKIESELHFQNYFKTTLTNKCKDQFISEKCTMRATESIQSLNTGSYSESEVCKDSEYYYEVVEIFMSIKRAIHEAKLTPKQDKIAVEYVKLVLTSNGIDIRDDLLMSRRLGCDKRTLQEVRRKLQPIIETVFSEEE